ncbi:lipopolysaccharide assembly protein LapA domain-containing protein [Pseudodesulfovibrio portus]|uniref:histidine kinase n=1 Tax=Pseudodesulfovibrio portus TaxID=231439 RepID=A0ABM8AQ95_9BACT|nr:lipopolysaccharide assembly protein LapA domain-containing protein [Pseudodesulfovibrio portus]BDQ33571.1 hypothetical protein JCM14722_11130 [Pseudodesulfovibrio portus]
MGSKFTAFRGKAHLAVSIALVLLCLLFILQNIEQTQISFLFWTISTSRSIMLLVTMLVGVIIGLVAVLGKRARKAAPVTPRQDSNWAEQQNTMANNDAERLELHSKLIKAEQASAVLEASQKESLDRIRSSESKQRLSEEELSTVKTALSDARYAISALTNEMEKLHEELDTKELIDRIIQHDLRGAISASVLLPEAILDDANLDENQKEIVTLIRDSGKKMLEILDSSLTIYRIEQGAYEKKFTSVNLRKVISTVIERIQRVITNSNQDISINCMDAGDQRNDVFLVCGDEFLLFSTFMNLITNAIEASPNGKQISITLSRNDYCTVSIRNHGEVPESIRDTFFNKMVTAGKKFGTGLGTYSAMLMVKAQNGSIELDCSEPGMTTIYVNLPKAEA